MPTLRGVLTDQVGEIALDVSGTIEAGRGGSFEFPDTPAVMEGVMNGQTFTLNTEDGQALSIKIDNVTPAGDGTSKAEFSVA